MKKLSPTYAQKLIKQKNTEISSLLLAERETSQTCAALDEDVSDLRKAYSFADTQVKIKNLQEEIISLKHAINLFNTSTFLEKSGYTIDAALVRMKMLTDTCVRMKTMADKQSVSRKSGFGSNPPEYVYLNYNPEDAKKMYDDAMQELIGIQAELDEVNLTSLIEVPEIMD